MNEWPDEAGESKARPMPAEPLAAEPGPCGCDPSGGIALRQTVKIINSRGLHARAAAKLVTVAERFSACVSVSRHGQTVPACSIMGLMMLGAGQGSEVLVEAEGWDAKEALEAIAGLMEAGFHED
ncbi:HPr family phosphocarrier protein [Roseomonas sp. ROY-5-3]|jgi:phosphocarrier protein|uniref:HPr family phosphocarrier protein n=2 Tax=Acetobacterales TaxID=3120395 RepID=A0ABS6H3N8_9PROT|nr:HPr family phosphocarrier protein [Roseomonas oleicola]MBU8543292.1 HPr family phosphocarrier protein [Roseomonas oleicola]